MHAFSPLVEAFLILDQPRQRLGHWAKALSPLDDGRAPPLASVTAYYDPMLDQALLGLRYDEIALGAERLAFVVEIALLAEIGMIQPAVLSDGDRRRFLNERLARCSIHISNQRHVVGALTELVRTVREYKHDAAPIRRPGTPPPIPAARGSVKPRGTTEDPVLLVAPRSTRDDIPRPPAGLSRAKSPQESRSTRAISPNIVRVQRATADAVHRAVTVMGDALRDEPGPDHSFRISAPPGTVSAEASPGRAKRAATTSTTEPYGIAHVMPPGIIYARYLRSGKWVPIRIGALSLRGAALMTGALPRLYDTVDIALSFAGHRALVRGPVNKLSSTEEAAVSGAPTFSVTFDLDDAARQQLTALLSAARAAKITIKPPPPRGAPRYPVEWPVCLGTMRGALRADALDVSREGMFVRPAHALALDTNLNFSAVLDDAGVPVSGRAKVVRHITEAEARSCGLVPGYGLHVVDMSDVDRDRWRGFLGRVEARADKRVLVGASPARLAEIQSVLAAAGYVVFGGTDPGALVQLASGESRPVDAALLDGGWLTTGTPTTWVESLFNARKVPYTTMHGDARRARATIDKLLAVV